MKPESSYELRLRVVHSARQIGLKPTARLFGASPQTVRKWVRRYQAQKRRGLADRSHAPRRCPHKTSPQLERQLGEPRQLSGFGPRRLKVEFQLPVSQGAIARILRQQGLVRPRKRKPVTKQDLRARKAAWPVFSKLCHDTKDLDDIPCYWTQAQALRLPLVQYTARELRPGLTFADYALPRSASLACVFAERVISQLAATSSPRRRATGATSTSLAATASSRIAALWRCYASSPHTSIPASPSGSQPSCRIIFLSCSPRIFNTQGVSINLYIPRPFPVRVHSW